MLDLYRRVGVYGVILGEMERILEWREWEGAVMATYARVLNASQKQKAA